MAASSEISGEFLENEFAKLKERSWQSWTDFEKDLSEFEKRTATAQNRKELPCENSKPSQGVPRESPHTGMHKVRESHVCLLSLQTV